MHERQDAPPHQALNHWFTREILSHDGLLVGYLKNQCPDPDDIPDLRQEIYARIYAAAARTRPRLPRAFLFATARHLMADRARSEKRVTIESVADIDALNILIDSISPEQHTNARIELRRVVRAIASLPPRRREVFILRRIEGQSIKAVAKLFNITCDTVENHMGQALRQLRAVTGRPSSARRCAKQ